MMTTNGFLPRLLYVGDVAVESTIAGPALLYRLLQNYPTDSLGIIESGIRPSEPERRLAKVTYETLELELPRLLYTRFGSYYAAYLHFSASLRSHKLNRIFKEFRPEAILTVAYGYSWLTAAALANRFDLPLHLIIHDDWQDTTSLPRCFQWWAKRQFTAVYKQAKTRLCISPYMKKVYEERYGLDGHVLPPSRALDSPVFDQPPTKEAKSRTQPVFAYAGSITGRGYADRLVALAEVLESVRGRLIIYCPLGKQQIRQLGLDRTNVIIKSLVPSNELIEVLRAEADVLFVPMTFEPEIKVNMEISFPSKLTDYTATGLALLINGPSYCSAARWARENAGIAEVVDVEDVEALGNAVSKLSDPQYRFELGKRALALGEKCFSHSAVSNNFHQALRTNSFSQQSLRNI
jgi:glycosyltransferase involved in cell wall biosynthesis